MKRPINQVMPDTTLRGLRQYIEGPPVEATVTRNGVTPLHRVEKLYERRYKQVDDKKIDRVNGVADWCGEQSTRVADSLQSSVQQAQALLDDMKAGNVTPDEVMNVVPRFMQETDQYLRLLDEVDVRGAAADELADVDPIEYEHRLLDRFPLLKDSLPIISEDYLLGLDDTDPLRGA